MNENRRETGYDIATIEKMALELLELKERVKDLEEIVKVLEPGRWKLLKGL